MKYSSEQLKILEDNTNYKQVIAAAGSGKTSTMIALLEKIIHEIIITNRIREICV